MSILSRGGIVRRGTRQGVTRGPNGLIASQSVPGLYNAKAGLNRFVRGLGRVAISSAGTGQSGIDVVMIGDSLLFGMAATTTRHDTISARLRNMLQNTFNPSGVLGGPGYVPFRCADTGGNWTIPGGSTIVTTPLGLATATTATGTNGTTNIAVASSATFAAGNIIYFGTTGVYRSVSSVPDATHVTVNSAVTTTNGESVQKVSREGVADFKGVWTQSAGVAANRLRTYANGATNQLKVWFNNSAPLSTRQCLSSLEIAYGTDNGTDVTGGTFTWDLSDTNTFKTAGQGTVGGTSLTGTISCSAAQAGSVRSGAIGGVLSKSFPYALQISAPAANQGLVEGVIGYYGDESCGIRLHNVCRVGAATGDNWNTATKAATITKWCGRTTLSTFAHLFIFDFITNDCSQQVALATFESVYGALLDLAIAGGACCLLVIPPLYDTSYLASAIPYTSYISSVFNLAAARPNQCAVLNLYEFTGNPTTTTALGSTGDNWINGSTGHHNDTGCEAIARLIYGSIMEAI